MDDIGGHDELRAHAHNRLGHVLNCADRRNDAIAAHQTAITILHTAGKAELLAPVLIDLGYTLWAVGQLEDARRALKTGLAGLPASRQQPSWHRAHATAGLGMIAQDSGSLDEAATCHRAAIAAFTQLCGADHPDTAQALDKLGYTLRLQGHLDDAIAAHQRAAGLLERRLRSSDPRVAMTLSNLGLAYVDAGRLYDAVAAQSRAHAIFRAALGPHHGHTAMASQRWAAAAAKADSSGQRMLSAGRTYPSPASA